MKEKIIKILNIVIDVLVVFVLIISLLVATLALTSKKQGVPNLFGYAPFTVSSDSMSGTFEKGDLIISKVTNDPKMKYEIGDVVTFKTKINGKIEFNTHRIVDIDKEGRYITQGDKKGAPVDAEAKYSDDIVAKWTGTTYSGVGDFIAYLRTQTGFFWIVLFPMILFFVYQAVRVVINIVAYNKEKTLAEAQAFIENAELTEEQKQKAIAEYLASVGQEAPSQETVQTPTESNNDSEQ